MPIHPTHQISLEDLSDAGIRVGPTEAATIARELALRVSRGELRGIPSSTVVRLSRTGGIHVEGPVASGREVERAARLLDALLPGFGAPPELRVPGALRLVVARALGNLDIPPYDLIEDFADALAPFAAASASWCVMGLVAGRHAAQAALTTAADTTQPLPSTISDVRRARRAARLTLAEISARTRIPVGLLREFESGDFANWPSGSYGLTQTVRYARAVRLDESLVLDIVLPLIDALPRAASSTPRTA